VFSPRPNVDSALVAFTRRPLPPDYAAIKRTVRGVFAHRRKTLPNSLDLSGVASRERAAAALAELGLGPAVRAEALRPEQFVELTRLIA
jgi:16S rRNA (adenine1518-N6/adenine1519-N6)-dimethyltransferase